MAEAISIADKKISIDPVMVGRLELPDETIDLPTQVETAYLTQLGYDPITPEEYSRDFRLAFRTERLARMSIVPWNSMVESSKEKEQLEQRIVMLGKQICDYDNDCGHDYSKIVADEQEKQEAHGLAREYGDTVSSFDSLRKTHGLTEKQNDIMLAARGVYLSFVRELFAAEARHYALLGKDTLIDAGQDYLQKAILAFTRMRFAEHQLMAGIMQELKTIGLMPEIEMAHVGYDELTQAANTGRSLSEIIQHRLHGDS